MEVIVKKWEHYNKALGKHIPSKRAYNEEMKRQGMVSFDKGKQMAQDARERSRRPYKVDNETYKFMNSLNADKNGKVKLGSKQLDYMKKIGVSFQRPQERPLEGGWDAT